MFVGIIFIFFISIVSIFFAGFPFIVSLHLSPLIIGIILGIVYSNIRHGREIFNINDGIAFSSKRLLKLGVILYGFRLNFNDISHVGLEGVIFALFIVCFIIFIGLFIGKKVLKMGTDSSLLVSVGTAICGAAAILAMSQVIKAKDSKVTAAVAVIVVLGILCMILYPIFQQIGILQLDDKDFGMFLGGSLHEVANVVGAASSFNLEIQNEAIIIKMIRVIFLIPTLVVINIVYLKKSEDFIVKSKTDFLKMLNSLIPWFAFLFLLMVFFNSIFNIPQNLINLISNIDTLCLTMAMVSLGLNTNFKTFELKSINDFILGLILSILLLFVVILYIKLV